MAANETSRVQSIDVLRTLALLCVLSIHSLRAAIAQVNGQDLSGLTGNQIAASCAIGLSTLGVPLFLMISGYLLLDRDYTKERTLIFFKRNLLPLVVSYEIFDLALAIVQYIGAGGVTVADYVKSALFIGPAPMGHLWYMQAIVGTVAGVAAARRSGTRPGTVCLCGTGLPVRVLLGVAERESDHGIARQCVPGRQRFGYVRHYGTAIPVLYGVRLHGASRLRHANRTGCGVCGYGGGARGIVRFRRMVESACRRFPVQSGVHAGGVGWVHAVPCRGTGVAR